MNKLEIPNAGIIEYGLMENFGENTPTISELLQTIIKGIAEKSVLYYKKTKGRDQLFIDSEGELHVGVTQSIAKLTPVFKTEYPVWREYSTTKSGNLDYWIFYNNIAFALELKLAHKGSFKGDCCVKRSIYNHFNRALKQLENVENNDILHIMEKTKGLAKIVLEEIIFYSKTNNADMELLEEYQQKIQNSFDTLFDTSKLNPKGLSFRKEPNMKALWYLDKNIALLEKGRFQENRLYPVIGFIGHVDYIKS